MAIFGHGFSDNKYINRFSANDSVAARFNATIESQFGGVKKSNLVLLWLCKIE